MAKPIRERRGGLLFVHEGGHGVNVFSGGRNIDMFNVGDFSKSEASARDIRTRN